MEGISASINLLVLPILGGYWFQYKFYGTHYRAERLTPQRLAFHAGLYALGLLIVAKLLVFVGDTPGPIADYGVSLLIFGVVPAFILLVLVSLAAVQLQKYLLDSLVDPHDDDSGISGSEELLRLTLGGLLAVLLLWVGGSIEWVRKDFPSAPPLVACVGIFALLLAVSFSYQRFIDRYFPFRLFSISMRIGLFGVIASLTLTIFFVRYAVLSAWWDHFVRLKGSGIPVLACFLGLVLWWPLNLLYPHVAANLRLHEKKATTALDRLLYQASVEQNLLSISMKDGKVYIGYVQELPPNPEDRNSYFEILPMNSGYRDKDTREMKLTTFYDTAYQRLIDARADPEEWLIFVKVLKIDDIVSAGRFDPDAYVEMQMESQETQEHEGWDDRSG